jgi:hypothetical protein
VAGSCQVPGADQSNKNQPLNQHLLEISDYGQGYKNYFSSSLILWSNKLERLQLEILSRLFFYFQVRPSQP